MEWCRPVGRRHLAALLDRRGVVVLDFKIITAGLFKVDRVSEVRFMRRGDAFNFVLGFMIGDVFVGFGNFFGAGDPEAIVVGVRLILRIRSTFVNHQAPRGIGMFNNRLLVGALDNFRSQKIGENRQRLVQRAAFIVTFGHRNWFQHTRLLIKQMF